MGLLLHLNIVGAQSLPLKEGFPRLYPYTQMVNRVVIDQFDPFRCTLACEPIEDIKKLPSTTKTFADTAEEHANAFKKTEGPIYIMYSGGIDSTSAVIAFINTWSEADLKRVYILASHHSVTEFPEFWNVINDKFEDRILPSFKHVEYYCKRGTVITGEHGDQVFGSDVIRRMVGTFGEKSIHAPWQQIMPTIYSHLFGPEIVPDFIARYEPTLAACPFPLRSSFDWIWWFNFTNKWQHVKYRMLAYKTWNNPKENFKKIQHFYDTPAWQRWSLDNHDKKIATTYDTYKLAAKEYIVKSTGFTEYMKKPKVGSLSEIWNATGIYEAIDTDFNYLTREQALEYIR